MTINTFERIDRSRTRLADEVYERLYSGILAARIGPGYRLIQEKIADDLDVSRTPVREALLRLEQEGIIEPAGRRGFVVRELTETEIRDNYQAREAIEGFAARIVALEAPDSALDRLTQILRDEANRRQDTIESAYRSNRAVHRAMVEASGNDFLVELFDVVWGRQVAMRLYAELFNQTDLVSQFDQDHSSLLEAFRSGDGDRAFEAMIDHIRGGLELQLRALAATKARADEQN
ncbi:MAG: GntR family transcriptional regulator [Acidimicrobiales bacterium]